MKKVHLSWIFQFLSGIMVWYLVFDFRLTVSFEGFGPNHILMLWVIDFQINNVSQCVCACACARVFTCLLDCHAVGEESCNHSIADFILVLYS